MGGLPVRIVISLFRTLVTSPGSAIVLPGPLTAYITQSSFSEVLVGDIESSVSFSKPGGECYSVTV